MTIGSLEGSTGDGAGPKGPQPAKPGSQPSPAEAPRENLSSAALRALAEAEERRAAIDARAAEIARTAEHRGRGGLEPVRYDDWEIKGIAADF